MKKHLSVIPLVLLVYLVAGPQEARATVNPEESSSQREEQNAQSYAVIEVIVKPGKIADFEQPRKERLAELKKQDYDLPICVYSMEFPHYYVFYPFRYIQELMTLLRRMLILGKNRN